MHIQIQPRIYTFSHAQCHVRWSYHYRLLTEVLNDSDLLGEHTKLFKVDESINLCLIAIIKKCQVLLEYWEEGYEGRCGIPLKFTILGHVVEGIHEASQVIHGLAVLGWHFLPCGLLTLDQTMIETTQNVKH